MGDENIKEVEKIMDKIKPFIAIAVLVLIVFCVIGVWKDIKLKSEIKESCGYESNEKVFCVCDKRLVSQIDIEGNPYFNGSLENLNWSELNPDK